MKSKNRFRKNKSFIEIEPPKNIEDHRDFLLRELKWMYDCFINEHKWKSKSFKSVAQSSIKYLQTKDQRLKKRKEEEEKKLRLISKNISSNINKFWQNVSKIVRHKKLSKLNELLRIKQFEKLDKLVLETEKYCGIKKKPNSEVSKEDDLNNDQEENNDNFTKDSDDDIDIENWQDIEEKDIQLDLEMETSEDDDEMDAELKELNEDANLNLEDLYLKYYGSNSFNKEIISNKEDKAETSITLSNDIKEKTGRNDLKNVENETKKNIKYMEKEKISEKSETESLLLESRQKFSKRELTDISRKNDDFSSLSTVEIPFLLRLNMREYQQTGLNWLVELYNKGLNGILADEMGLGKTIQTISLLAYLACYKENWGPHLIVVPTSVMLNWEMEFKRWLPSFKVVTYFGTPKERQKKRIGWNDPNSFNVCIASYTLILQDAHIFRRKQWQYLVLDEAQNIKNFRSQKWQVMLSFNTKRRLLLTGTPLQNNLMELWSLLHFLMPHIFTSHHDFKTWFSDPLTSAIENQQIENEKNLLKRLHSVLRPFLLRRLKRDVEKQMPSKIEHVIKCPLSKRQKELYDEFLESKSTQTTLAGGDYIGLMNILMQLRKVCNHPDLFEPRLIKTSIFEEKLMIKFSTSSLLYFPENCPMASSNVPSLGLNISTNNHFLRGKYLNRTNDKSRFEYLCNHRFVNLPNIFLLNNEMNMSMLQTHTQNELSYKDWLTRSGNCIEKISTRKKLKTDITYADFHYNKVLPDTNRFIELQMNHFASFGDNNLPIIGLDSNMEEYELNVLVGNLVFSESMNSAKIKAVQNNDSNMDLLINKSFNHKISPNSFEKIATKISFEWKPSCDYPFLLNESIQTFHKEKLRKGNYRNHTGMLNSFLPQRVIYGQDCRKFLWKELNTVKRIVFDHSDVAYSSSYPKIPNSRFNRRRFTNSLLPPIICQKSNEKSSSSFISKTKLLDKLLFVRTDFLKQFPMLKQFTILLPKKVISTTDSISIVGKDSKIKKEWYTSNYFSPNIIKFLKSYQKPLYPIFSLQDCLIPPKRIIEDDCGKLQILSTLLHRLFNEGHRCIIFTQMSKMLDVLETYINYRSYNYLRLDGSTKVDDRQRLVNRFNRDKRIFLFISSTRSGGVGLNLTGADTVIFYDSDWNPAMDRQAMDRCHRIGQTRDVNIYRLISEWTIEESIFKKQLQKRLLDDVVVDQGHFTSEFITKGDIQNMIGSRTQKMLNSENMSIYNTRILHESSSNIYSNPTAFNNDPVKREFEDVLAAVEDIDDTAALNKSSKELAAEKDDFINEFQEEKTKAVEANVSIANNEKEPPPQIENGINNLLDYCINFLENVSFPPEIQHEIELLELQIENIDKEGSIEKSDIKELSEDESNSDKSNSDDLNDNCESNDNKSDTDNKFGADYKSEF